MIIALPIAGLLFPKNPTWKLSNFLKFLFLSFQIENLETSVKKLILFCEKLQEENESIKHNNNLLMRERSELQSKNDKVRGQVEAMVHRLKSMDKAS